MNKKIRCETCFCREYCKLLGDDKLIETCVSNIDRECVDLIASGYECVSGHEWVCPYCNILHTIPAATERVECVACGRNFGVVMINHAY